jgi:hypothetical protein
MAYDAEIRRNKPGCFIFLIDQSGSMSDPFGYGDTSKTKSEALADVLNRILSNLIIKCSHGDEIREYFDINIIGYGGNTVGKLFIDNNGSDLVSIKEIEKCPIRIEDRVKKEPDGAGGLVEVSIKFPVWINPVSNGGTPMVEALSLAKGITEKWVTAHPDNFPPIIINITDGESTDGDPSEVSNQMQNICTSDGNALLFNIHLSSSKQAPVEFPNNDKELPDQFAKLLFNMSSKLPPHIQEIAKQEKYNVDSDTRGFTFNADMVSLVKFLDIGTRPSNLR